MSDILQLHAVVHGYVQGVGFRAFVLRRARSLGLAGYVRNTWDGNVEVLAQGPRPDVESLLGDLHRGPSEAQVSLVDIAWKQTQRDLVGFDLRY